MKTWVHSVGDAALRALSVNRHRLRRLLGEADTVVHRAHRIAVDSRRIWCDTSPSSGCSTRPRRWMTASSAIATEAPAPRSVPYL